MSKPQSQRLSQSPTIVLPDLAGATNQLLDISVTERAQFRSCRRRWWLQTIENLQPKHYDSIALSFGTAMHAALECLYTGGTREEVIAHIDEWVKDMEERETTQEQWEEVLDHADLGDIMLTNYFRFDEVARVQLGRPLAVEGFFLGDELHPSRPKGYPPEAEVLRHESKRLMVPIVHPDTKEVLRTDRGVAYLTGRMDLVTERKTPKSGLWIVDHKNLASPPSDKGMDFDDQITGYCYIHWRWTGRLPRGVVYNVLIKNAPKEPRMVQGKRKSEGLVLSTAKDQQCTPDAYRAALVENGLMDGNGRIESEKHAECLSALLARGWDPFFRRFEATRSLHQMQMFERRLWSEYLDMQEARFNDPSALYPNPIIKMCPYCSVSSICLGMEEGNDVEDIIESGFVVGPDRKAIGQ